MLTEDPARVRARASAWYYANKERKREYDRAYRAKNRERRNAQVRARTASDPEGKAERNRRYKDRHPERVVDTNSRWWRANRERVYEGAHRRRALKRGASVAPVDRQAIYDRDGGRCHLCGDLVPRQGFHLDHIVPLARGGEHAPWNVAVAHPTCNWRKNQRSLPSQVPVQVSLV